MHSADSSPGHTGRPRVLLAKTSLDGHWRGVSAVGRALRDAGLEVVMIGMARPDQIVATAVQEDIDLVALNVGGRVEVVGRILESLREAGLTTPVITGGTVPPRAAAWLEDQGVPVFPPGSALSDIVRAAQDLLALGSGGHVD